MLQKRLTVLLLLAPCAAFAAAPVETARSPDGKLVVLQTKDAEGYTLYTRLSGGRLKKWKDTPREPEVRWHGNIAAVRISGGSYYAFDAFSDGIRNYTAADLVALHEKSGCYLGTDGDGHLAFAKLFDPQGRFRLRPKLPDMAQTATPLSALDNEKSRFLPDGSFRLVYINRKDGISQRIFRRPCQDAPKP